MSFVKGSTQKARKLAQDWVTQNIPLSKNDVVFGLPEYSDRIDAWQVPLLSKYSTSFSLGEIKINKILTEIIEITGIDIIKDRLKKARQFSKVISDDTKKGKTFVPAPIPNKIILGDSTKVLEDYPPDSVQLVVTSPPYYNAKPEYSEYVDYQEYLDFLRKVIVRCSAILSEGRFFVINVSPVLIKRQSRSSSSKRIAIPFDVHKIMENAGFDFIDDIIWEKPEGAGWNLGRGRRFKADRHPLQYKPVPVTEYVLVYRKKTDRLIDWNIRSHYDQKAVEDSTILGDYDVTNVWRIPPSSNRNHPATFPDELIRRIIRYYSFIDDMVLDPFAGSGTVGRVAIEMKRRFMLIDKEYEYFEYMKKSIIKAVPPDTRVDCYVYDEIEEK